MNSLSVLTAPISPRTKKRSLGLLALAGVLASVLTLSITQSVASALTTSGPISSMELSNSTLTEQNGQLFVFNAEGLTSDVASTGLTATFSSGTAAWAVGTNNGALTSGVSATVPLAYGFNVITVTHTLSGVNTAYTINILRGGQFSNFEIQTAGLALSPAFDPAVFEYTLPDVPYTQTSISYIVTHTFNDAGYLQCNQCDWWQFQSRGIQSFNLNTGANRIDWSFNPGVGPTLHYYVNINRAPAFDSTHLGNLTLSSSALTEQSGQLYKFDANGVETSVTSTQLTATFASGTAAWVNGTHSGSLTSGTASTVALDYGYNTINVTHTLSGVNTVYKIFILRGGIFSDFEIKTAGLALSPAFDPNVFEYTLPDVPYTQTSISYIVTHTFNDAGYLQCNQCDWWQFQSRGIQSFNLNTGANRIDWSFNPGVGPTLHYYVNVNRAPTFDSTHLGSLSLTSSALTEQGGQLYKFNADGVESTVTSTGLTATFASGTAAWVNGTHSGSLASGTVETIPLDYGFNTITVTHTRAGVDTVYRIYILRGGRFSAMEIQTAGVSLSPAFDPDVFYYRLTDVPYSTTSISYLVTHTFNDAGYLQCNQCDWWQFQSRGTQSFILNNGANCIDWSFNPGVGPTLHYYIAVNRDAPGAAATGSCVPPAPTTTTSTTAASTTTVPRSSSTSVPSSSSSSSTSSTSTTVASSGTTAPATSGGTASNTSSETTIAQGQASIATIAPGGSTETTVATPLLAVSKSVSVATTTTTTTLPPEVAAPTVANKPAPTAQVVSPGAAVATVNGKKIEIAITRENNQLVFTGAGLTGTLRGTKASGEAIELDVDGNLRIESGDKLSVESTGFGADSLIEVWMFSTPTQVGEITADALGKGAGTFTVFDGLEDGNHRVVLKGVNTDGEEVVMSIGIVVGALDVTSTLSRILIAVPIALAIAVGLFIPNQIRRRRRKRLGLAA